MRKIPASFLLFLLGMIVSCLSSCTPTRLAAVGSKEYTGYEEDEKRLWQRSREEEERIDNSGELYQDTVLNQYLNQVAFKLVPDEVKGHQLEISVKVIRNPLLNAFTYPNGVIYVHTGILAKMQNEANRWNLPIMCLTM